MKLGHVLTGLVLGALVGCGGSVEATDNKTPDAGAGASQGGAGQAGASGSAQGGSAQGGSAQGGAGQGGSPAGQGGGPAAGSGGAEGGAGPAGEGGAAPAGSGGAGQGGAGGEGGAGGSVPDPAVPPAVELTVWKGKLTPGVFGKDISVWLPKGATGKLPLVLFAHGFQLNVNDYAKTFEHIARFGYVVASVDFEASFIDQDHHAPVDSMKQALELLLKSPPPEVGSVIDPERVASMGHSLGGKGAIWAALELPEIKAVVALDPVDDDPSPLPNPSPKRPSLAPEMMGGLKVPALYIGAQLSPTGVTACAPKASSACSFAAATPPAVFSRHFTVEQFGHMQFLDNSSCLACFACAKGTNEANGQIFARAQSVAFLEMHLKGNAGYGPFLDAFGDQASSANVCLDKAEQASFCGP